MVTNASGGTARSIARGRGARPSTQARSCRGEGMPHDHIVTDLSAISRQEGADMKRIPLDPSAFALIAATGLAGSLMSRHTAFFSPEGRISRRGLITLGGLG